MKIDSLKSQSTENLRLARTAIDNLLAERARKALETTAGHFGLSVEQILARDVPAVVKAPEPAPAAKRGRPRKAKPASMVDARGVIWAGKGRKPKNFDSATAQPVPTVPANGAHATA